MRSIKTLLMTAAAAAAFLLIPTPKADAQISFGVQIGGPAPACPYGYFDYAPYNCSPYGYYGPQWFNRGVFYGAGPWYRGPRGFRGYVNHDYDPRFGYRGDYPEHGGYREPDDHFRNFHASHYRDGYGHEQEWHGGGRGNGHGNGHDQHGKGHDDGHDHGDHGHGDHDHN
jgi:hypothetical protein